MATGAWNIFKKVHERVKNATGVSISTITRCLRQEKATGAALSPKKKGQCGRYFHDKLAFALHYSLICLIDFNRKKMLVDSFTEGVVRRKILEGYTNNIL